MFWATDCHSEALWPGLIGRTWLRVASGRARAPVAYHHWGPWTISVGEFTFAGRRSERESPYHW